MAKIDFPALGQTRSGRQHPPTGPTVMRPGLRRITTRHCKGTTPTQRLSHSALAKAFLTACLVLGAGA